MTEGKIAIKEGNQLFCSNNHLVATAIKDIYVSSALKVGDFNWDISQPKQKPKNKILPCFCGSPWLERKNDGRFKPINMKQ